jgi:hypothetical protein
VPSSCVDDAPVRASPPHATGAAHVCGYTPNLHGPTRRGCVDTRSGDGDGPRDADVLAAWPRRGPAWGSAAGRIGADRRSDTLAVPKPRNDPADPPRLCGDAPGLKVSPRHLPQHVVVELLLRQEPLEPRVLLLQGLQAHDILGTHRLVSAPPALIRLDRDLEMPTDPRDIFTLTQQPIGLPQLADNLLWRMPRGCPGSRGFEVAVPRL